MRLPFSRSRYYLNGNDAFRLRLWVARPVPDEISAENITIQDEKGSDFQAIESSV